MTEKEVYQFYNDTVKIIYSEIEAKKNSLPVELLFEIHSAFDHLKRIHIDNEPEELQAQKQSFFRFIGSFIVGIITGVIGSIIVWFITQ